MKFTSDVLENFDFITFKEFLDRQDPLAGFRKEYKFLIPLDLLPEILSHLKYDFVYCTHDGDVIHRYKSTYYDTPDLKLFRFHRQGKWNRIKIRLREYVDGEVNHFIESKEKIKKVHTKKERAKIHDLNADVLNHDFVKKNLSKHGVEVAELEPKIKIGYSRLFLVSKETHRRITVDFNIYAENRFCETVDLLNDYCVLEIKDTGIPRDLIKYLQRTHKIRRTGFSKYCLCMCLMNDDLKGNKWKRILRLNKQL